MSVKVIFVGQEGCGKTCIVNRIVYDTFSDKSKSTIIQTINSTTLTYDERSVPIQIFDLAGSEKYTNTVANFFHNAKIAVLVFSIDNLKSFENVDMWKNLIDKELNTENETDSDYAFLILVGTKSDKIDERKVEKSNAQEKARNFGCSTDYIEVSSLTGDKIKKLKDEIAKIAINCINDVVPFQDIIETGNKADTQEKKCCF